LLHFYLVYLILLLREKLCCACCFLLGSWSAFVICANPCAYAEILTEDHNTPKKESTEDKSSPLVLPQELEASVQDPLSVAPVGPDKFIPLKKKEAAKKSDPYVNNIEWVGAAVGFGFMRYKYAYHDVGYYQDKSSSPILYQRLFLVDLYFLNFQFPWITWTAVEFHPAYHVGLLGIGTRVALRIPLHRGFQQECRIGIFFGMDMFNPITEEKEYIDEKMKSTAIRPGIQYIYNTEWGSLGAGLDIAAYFLEHPSAVFSSEGNEDLPSKFPGFNFYIRFTAGRTKLW